VEGVEGFRPGNRVTRAVEQIDRPGEDDRGVEDGLGGLECGDSIGAAGPFELRSALTTPAGGRILLGTLAAATLAGAAV
jgi:hypothetical protein